MIVSLAFISITSTLIPEKLTAGINSSFGFGVALNTTYDVLVLPERGILVKDLRSKTYKIVLDLTSTEKPWGDKPVPIEPADRY